MVFVPPHPTYGDLEDDDISYSRHFLSIATTGQDEPITVRPHPTPIPPVLYECVTGFSRCNIIEQLAKMSHIQARESGIPVDRGANPITFTLLEQRDPTIKAFIRELNDGQAVELNTKENTARLSANVPDLAHAIKRIRDATPGRSTESIAKSIGRSQPYVCRLLRVMDGFANHPQVLTHWRESAAKGTEPLGHEQMLDIAQLPEAQRAEVYFARGRRKKTMPLVEKRRETVRLQSTERAETMGMVLAALVKEGIITCHREPREGIRAILSQNRVRQSLYTDEQWERFATACQEAYEKGLAKP